ncbi:hypothetical protein CVO77_16640 [Sphingopyxis lindanitolerans]|uniref:Uncharacterized protein n=1 Tax=Sphingopyxis lindanitolerans TaxID=2054227 RepID=A0A2S8B2T0_9SPHN|nr:hypothetical protein [Sphingopyxis lindanitolerans]PQM26636.1 hypothetical protein CVO77_16640 [Sphingopyxis lindanitolerans]
MDLTAIGFIIAVVGITLQLSDAFPEHRETRKVIVFMSIGLFLGILASAALGAKYNVTGNIDRRFALLFALAGLGALFGLIAVVVTEEERRIAAGAVAFCFGGAFLATGLFVAAGSADPHYSYSTDEVLMLANAAEQAGQYEIAIDRLEELDRRLTSADASERLQKRVQKIRDLQAGDPARP